MNLYIYIIMIHLKAYIYSLLCIIMWMYKFTHVILNYFVQFKNNIILPMEDADCLFRRLNRSILFFYFAGVTGKTRAPVVTPGGVSPPSATNNNKVKTCYTCHLPYCNGYVGVPTLCKYDASNPAVKFCYVRLFPVA